MKKTEFIIAAATLVGASIPAQSLPDVADDVGRLNNSFFSIVYRRPSLELFLALKTEAPRVLARSAAAVNVAAADSAVMKVDAANPAAAGTDPDNEGENESDAIDKMWGGKLHDDIEQTLIDNSDLKNPAYRKVCPDIRLTIEYDIRDAEGGGSVAKLDDRFSTLSYLTKGKGGAMSEVVLQPLDKDKKPFTNPEYNLSEVYPYFDKADTKVFPANDKFTLPDVQNVSIKTEFKSAQAEQKNAEAEKIMRACWDAVAQNFRTPKQEFKVPVQITQASNERFTIIFDRPKSSDKSKPRLWRALQQETLE